jgi:hypothetical protein
VEQPGTPSPVVGAITARLLTACTEAPTAERTRRRPTWPGWASPGRHLTPRHDSRR